MKSGLTLIWDPHTIINCTCWTFFVAFSLWLLWKCGSSDWHFDKFIVPLHFLYGWFMLVWKYFLYLFASFCGFFYSEILKRISWKQFSKVTTTIGFSKPIICFVYSNNSGENMAMGVGNVGAADGRVISMRDGLTMAAYVGQRRTPLRLSRAEADTRFPEGIGDNVESQNACHILCHPIIRADGDLSGVIELHRNTINSPFYAEDEEVVNSYVVWGGIALHYAELNAVMNKSKKLNEFLLDVVR